MSAESNVLSAKDNLLRMIGHLRRDVDYDYPDSVIAADLRVVQTAMRLVPRSLAYSQSCASRRCQTGVTMTEIPPQTRVSAMPGAHSPNRDPSVSGDTNAICEWCGHARSDHADLARCRHVDRYFDGPNPLEFPCWYWDFEPVLTDESVPNGAKDKG
jgi:hypothetical protein